MVQQIKRIGVMQQGKLMGALYFLLGIILAVCVWGFSSMMPSAATGKSFGMGMGIGFVIVAPFVYGVIGFIGGIIVAWLYNICAGMVGGMEIELE